MKKHYEASIILDKIEDAIEHAREYELPLKSIELNPEEWAMFKQAVMTVPGWKVCEADFGKRVIYHGMSIFEGPAP